MAACWIDKELALRASVTRVSSVVGASIVGRNGNADYSGLVYPYYWPGDSHAINYRLRRDNPEIEYDSTGARKLLNKYLSAPGSSNHFHLVPGTDPALLSDTSLDVVITEGEKKCLALYRLAWHGLSESAEHPRFLPIGLAGIYGWRGKVAIEPGPNGQRKKVVGLIPDFSRVA